MTGPAGAIMIASALLSGSADAGSIDDRVFEECSSQRGERSEPWLASACGPREARAQRDAECERVGVGPHEREEKMVGPRRTEEDDERYALIVSGATGGEPYSGQHGKWRAALAAVLRDKLGVDPGRTTVLAGEADATAALPRATREELRRALATYQGLTADDLLLVVLIGHGTADADAGEAKFNLVGPDLSAAEWRDLLRPVRARVVFVNTTSASFPFLERLSGPRRVVITATDSLAQRFVTVFPEHFIQALADPAADVDKNGRVSVWEAFSAASTSVRQYYEQRGQLATERALLDDNGDGVGREAGTPGGDGGLASRIYLDAHTGPETTTDPVLVELLQRRAALEAQVEELRARKQLMPAADYAAEFERLMIELARVSRDIRNRKS